MKNEKVNDGAASMEKSQKEAEEARRMERLSVERIETARTSIAKALNLIEGAVEEVGYACEQMHWNDMVVWDMRDAASKLGFSLATLSTWFDDPEE